MVGRRHDGRVAIVTGAASGIGAATAERLAGEGAAVVLADVADTRGEEVAARIRAAGGTAEYRRCDVSDQDDWATLLDHVGAAHGRLDLLHSNAYVDRAAPAHELRPTDWQQVLAVSLTGSYLGVAAALPLLRRARGAIVLTSSVHALVGMPGHPAYAAAKGGLCALGRQLAVEYAPHVRVNVVIPGPIMTAAWDRVDEATRQRSLSATPLARFGEPAEVAAAVSFLGSDEASFITGAQLVVDGGWTVMKDSA